MGVSRCSIGRLHNQVGQSQTVVDLVDVVDCIFANAMARQYGPQGGERREFYRRTYPDEFSGYIPIAACDENQLAH